MSAGKYKTKKGIRFVLAVGFIFVIALVIVGRATFGGAVQDSDFQYSDDSLFFMQSAIVFVYSTVFTLLCAIPLGFVLLEADPSSQK
ncbi:MAG: DUF2534 family protein [Scandinavium sp.]|uniref:DUF2534 family protein n=1 Tax=Scandinavium sp. TaxID=2830653 RepID=UPI003F3EB685